MEPMLNMLIKIASLLSSTGSARSGLYFVLGKKK